MASDETGGSARKDSALCLGMGQVSVFEDRHGVRTPVGYRACNRPARSAAAIALMRFMAHIAEPPRRPAGR
jgi:hypothetical protein